MMRGSSAFHFKAHTLPLLTWRRLAALGVERELRAAAQLGQQARHKGQVAGVMCHNQLGGRAGLVRQHAAAAQQAAGQRRGAAFVPGERRSCQQQRAEAQPHQAEKGPLPPAAVAARPAAQERQPPGRHGWQRLGGVCGSKAARAGPRSARERGSQLQRTGRWWGWGCAFQAPVMMGSLRSARCGGKLGRQRPNARAALLCLAKCGVLRVPAAASFARCSRGIASRFPAAGRPRFRSEAAADGAFVRTMNPLTQIKNTQKVTKAEIGAAG